MEDNIITAAMLPRSIKYFYAPKTLTEIRGARVGGRVISAFNSSPDDSEYSYPERSSLKYIELPTTVTTIGIGAFANTYLTKIDLSNISVIDDYAFKKSNLQQVSLRSRTIGKESFADCPLSKIELQEGVEEIGDNSFYSGRSEKEIYIPSTLKRIGKSAFNLDSYRNTETVSVFISNLENWLTIDFDDSNNPLKVQDRQKSHLYINRKLIESLTIPQNSTSIPKYAFKGCSSIQKVTIGDQVTAIGGSAFKYCSNLQTVSIGNGVTTIPTSAFQGCWKLETVYIGKNVTEIESEAFYDAPINEVHCLGTTPPSIQDRNFNNVNKETAKLYVPKGCYQTYFLSNWGSIFTNIIEMEE